MPAPRTHTTSAFDRILTEEGLTLSQVARDLDISRQLLWQFTRRTRTPEQPLLRRLALALQVPESALVHDTGRWR